VGTCVTANEKVPNGHMRRAGAPPTVQLPEHDVSLILNGAGRAEACRRSVMTAASTRAGHAFCTSRRMERWGAQETSSTAIQRRGECTPLAYVSSAACYDVLTGPFPDFRGSAHTRLSAHELLCQQLLAVWRHATCWCCSAVISHRLGNTMQGMQARECGTTVPEERREG
jgi:hypothetical protein